MVGNRRLRHAEELLWLLPVFAVTASLFLTGQRLGALHGLDILTLLESYVVKALRVLPVFFPVLVAGIVLERRRARLGGEPSTRRFDSPLLVAAAVIPLLLMPLLFTGFGMLKMLMPLYAPFAWDDAFAAMDRQLFLGQQPWVFTHAIVNTYTGTLVIDRIYTLWILLLSCAIVGFAFFAPRADRARFFLTFAAAWLVLGVGGAYLFSSAGPCFAAASQAASAPDYAPLMAKLNAYSSEQGGLGAVHWQQILWNAHKQKIYSPGMGISAMPSLHNAIAILYALALTRFGKLAAAAGWAFVAIIFFGSIHLGWHYAVDGLLAAVVTYALWRGAGFYLSWSGYDGGISDFRAIPDLRPQLR
ncbi:phosphatase PAP2 family protein [Allosphingosinicella vermicomposti]|uniref:phosphatase PAP2 family protein n=1 Tax=Allosphingosinicella vermicomposti TaxID=614671 RepID=UPI00131A5886|nr:phosphatase PAP2 family protein [Allosphingosinicella vermicomposti]